MSITIGNITKKIKSNQQNVKINLVINPEFEQTNVIRKRTKQNLDKLKVEEKKDTELGDIIFRENEVINIPKKLDDLFDNLLCDNYYLYGISINSSSFLHSLLYILHKEFKFKDHKDQVKFSTQLKEDLVKELDEYFKNNKYGKLGFNKTSMLNNIENNNFESAELHYLSDYYNINTIVLDYYKFIYYRGENYNSDNNNIIIIKYNDIYLPLIHIFGEHPDNLIYKCIVNKLKINNLKKKTVPEAEETSKVDGEVEATLEAGEAEETSKVEVESEAEETPSLKLRAISAYKLNDLQKLAEEHNIPITLGGKKQTKQQLYNKLKEI